MMLRGGNVRADSVCANRGKPAACGLPKSSAGRQASVGFPARRVSRTPGMRVSAVSAPEKASSGPEVVSAPVYSIPISNKTTRPRVVVLGSGWASMSFIKALPKDIAEKYEVMLVSPRNYFLYTPLLPAVATGTMEERSIVEPVRNLLVGKGEYYEAVCKDIDPVKKSLVCCFPKDAGFPEACFQLSYDVLIVGVGSVNNTFGIKGVSEYCNYFKSIEDANKLRSRVSECFERASLPGTTAEERKKLLSFVVVGGGPTGVEVAAEMHDMIEEDLVKLYPRIIPDVEIRIVDLMDHVLSTYDRAISNYTAGVFQRAGVKLVLNSRVASVSDGVVSIINKQNEVTEVPFGACVWATGIAMNPFVKAIQAKIPEQKHFRSVETDEFMRVRGSDGSIFAFGDSSTIFQPKAMEFADRLFDEADTNKDGKLTMEELAVLLKSAAKTYPHFTEHARFLDAKSGGFKRFGGLVNKQIKKETAVSPLSTLDQSVALDKQAFASLLGQIDSGLRALPATAQVASQQGQFVADLLKNNMVTGSMATTTITTTKGFNYFHKGSAAYVGSDNAVFDVPIIGPLTGWYAGVMWKSFETYSQISFRNRCLVFTDWLRTKMFGRDISRV